MTLTHLGVSPLVGALNDPTRTRIGNPWRGTYHLSIAIEDAREANALAGILNKLGIAFQANYRRVKKGGKAYLAVYELGSLQALLDALANDLHEKPKAALETLVRARGPIPEDILRKIDASVNWGRTYYQIADRMNELRVVDGMGGMGWSARKVKTALSEYEQRREHERKAA